MISLNKLKAQFPNLVIALALFTPPLFIGSFAFRPEFLVGCVLMAVLLVGYRKSPQEILFVDRANRWLIALILSFLLSSVYARIVLGLNSSLRDVTEYIRVGYYFLLYTISAKAFNRGTFYRTTQLLVLGLLVTMFFSILQYLNFAGINYWLTPIYATPDQMIILYSPVHRVVGTFGNSNLYGFVLACTAAIITCYIIQPDLSRRALILLGGVLLLVLLVVLLTFSRTAQALALGGMVLAFALGVVYRRHTGKRIWVFLLVFATCMVVFLLFAPEGFLLRLKDAINLKQDLSYIDRLRMWQGAWDLIKLSPVFGWGPAKLSMATFLDNEYVLVLRRYGLVGLVCYLGIFLSLLKTSLSRKWKQTEFFPLSAGFAITILLTLGFGITAGMFYNFQISSIFFVLAGSLQGVLARDPDLRYKDRA